MASFPLVLSIDGRFDDDVERALQRAVRDWNAVFRDTLKMATPAFIVGPSTRSRVYVAISPAEVFFAPATARFAAQTPMLLRPAALTYVVAQRNGVIHPSIHIAIRQSVVAGDATRETFFYRVIAHELGHALGLPHEADPRSLMCCVPGTRPDAEALRHPDVRTVRPQLGRHYFRFWTSDEH